MLQGGVFIDSSCSVIGHYDLVWRDSWTKAMATMH